MTYIYNSQLNSKKPYQTLKDFHPIKDKKILAFSPHSDDLSIGAGGFLSLLAQSNKVQPILAFSGWRGVGGLLEKIKAIKARETEMELEAEKLGLRPPFFLRLSTYDNDNLVTRQKDLQVIKKVIKQFRPQVVFLPNPNDDHPRHRLLARLCLGVFKEIRPSCGLFFYEAPWTVFSSKEFNFIVSLTSLNFKKKIVAIKAHKSQLERTNFIRLAKAISAWRAGVVPEQKILGFGCGKINLGNWLEVFRYKKLN